MHDINTIYLAGKISDDIDNYKGKFYAAAAFLEASGYAVMNPAVLPGNGFDYEDYLAIGRAMLDACDAICVLPDWSESDGARDEVRIALTDGKPVLGLEQTSDLDSADGEPYQMHRLSDDFLRMVVENWEDWEEWDAYVETDEYDDTPTVAEDLGWKDDSEKPRMGLVPWTPLLTGIARVMMHGAEKYGPDNLGKLPVERYRNALMRHIAAYVDDPDGVDVDSGLSHLDHVAANVAIIKGRECIAG